VARHRGAASVWRAPPPAHYGRCAVDGEGAPLGANATPAPGAFSDSFVNCQARRGELFAPLGQECRLTLAFILTPH